MALREFSLKKHFTFVNAAVLSAAVLLSGCNQNSPQATTEPVETAEAAPLSSIGQPYLTGQEVADMYEKYTFCYPDAGVACSTTEELTSRSANQIQINTYMLAKNGKTINGVDDLIYDTLTDGTSWNPQGRIMIDTQVPSLEAWGLCRSKSQKIQDAQKEYGYYVLDLNNLSGQTKPFSAKLQEDFRAINVKYAMQTIGDTSCSQYSIDPATNLLKEDIYIDGVFQTGSGNTIKLLPRGQFLNLSPQ